MPAVASVRDRAIIAVLGADNTPVGVGCLVAPTLALTCAHVVNAALDLPQDAQEQPANALWVAQAIPRSDPVMARVVRYPDPVPCDFCRDGRSDLCTNGKFLERGIRGANGFCASQWVAPKEGLVEVPDSLDLTAVLVEPTSIVVKACVGALQVASQRLGRPARSAVVIGGGTIGVLSMLYLVAQAMNVTLVGTDAATGPAGRLAELCGARYLVANEPWPDVELLMECSGSEDVAERLLTDPELPRFAWIVGIAEQPRPVTIDASELLRRMVLANRTVAGVVSSIRHDYAAAASFLVSVPRSWLDLIITRTVSLDAVADGLISRPGDVKVVVELI
jgi:glucose 1-dehydrogenase